ncbi:hypothetical protein AWB83_06710 [Caballeronia ptereochthonis]|uniref:Uncharacterized protein n=1 Tax=Caballeronia ptereochthonis TaxID=1777144 RepID=A0A158E882_9BURK|nr:hypothetical protein AWB83_06710 [Caballeronia ptereochthonis]
MLACGSSLFDEFEMRVRRSEHRHSVDTWILQYRVERLANGKAVCVGKSFEPFWRTTDDGNYLRFVAQIV